MWIEELSLENIKCFDRLTLRFGDKNRPKKWTTLVGENGVGKSSILQAIGLLLAGPEGANNLLTRPVGWLRDESKPGKLSAKIHKSDNDPGEHGEKKKRAVFNFTYFVTGSEKLTIRNREYTEPAIVENKDRTMTWLRQNAFSSKGRGWFAAGFGAFRRLTRRNQIIVPALQPPERYAAFMAQFNENEPLAVFEQWFVYLDYRIAKASDDSAKRQRDIAIQAINRLLPEGANFDSVSQDGRILFNVNGQKVPTLSLSDGYRSVLALAGDLVWRLLMAFPDTSDALKEEGVILIDELDIHLHPTWQRTLPAFLRELFPNLQFIISTHSPFVAAGAGEDASTYRLIWEDGKIKVADIHNLAFMGVDRILKGPAFEVVSLFSERTEDVIQKYYSLQKKTTKTKEDWEQLDLIEPIVSEAINLPPLPGSLEEKVDEYLKEVLNDQSPEDGKAKGNN